MKKLFFFFAMLTSVAASAQSGVTVNPVSANYANKTVTFTVSWLNSSRTGTHNSKVWVFVDYRTVTGNASTGNWSRALISGTPTTTSGTPSRETENDKGFWLQGTSGSSGTYNATVTVVLSNVPDKFTWCAYASDYPPNAKFSGDGYQLKGTPPFTITYNNNISSSTTNTTFDLGCVNAIADATGNPAGIVDDFNPGAITAAAYANCYNTAGNTTAVTTAPSGGNGVFSYSWTVSYNGGEAVIISGATGANYTPPATTTGGTYVYTRRVKMGSCIKNSTGTITRNAYPDYITIACNSNNLNVKTCVSGSFCGTCSIPSCPSGWRHPTGPEWRCMNANRSKFSLAEFVYVTTSDCECWKKNSPIHFGTQGAYSWQCNTSNVVVCWAANSGDMVNMQCVR
ncbi:MAG: hypothetical protein LBQ28_10060 [Prevotellaceae bacterium]|jgi:hypothetical protein|nr:hypothetical protein [Prevotellaceae bacterium]